MSTPSIRFTPETKCMLESILDKRRRLQEKRKVLEAELFAVDRAIADSKAEYGSLYNKAAPVMSLPDEITSLVFWFSVCAVLDSHGVERYCPFRQRRMEVVISHVCRRWMSIAVDLPCIWSTFSVKTEEENPRLPLDRLPAYLTRSKARLLDLSFDFREDLYSNNPGKAEKSGELIRMTIPHSERWHRLHIVGAGAGDIDNQILNAIWKFKNISVPNLVHFTCHNVLDYDLLEDYEAQWEIKAPLKLGIFQSGAPKLASLLVDRLALTLGLPPLSNITTLRLEESRASVEDSLILSPKAFLEIVSIPGLTNLSIYDTSCLVCDPPKFLQEVGVQTIVAPHLCHLRLGYPQSMIKLLQLIEAPQLETLVLFSVRFQSWDISSHATTFPALHSLTLDDCTMPDLESFLHLSQRTPNLINLTIARDFASFHRHAERLVGMQQIVWPKLSLVNINISGPDIAPYMKFIEAPFDSQLTFAIPQHLVNRWRGDRPAELALLEERFNIVELPHPIAPRQQWPPQEDSSGWLRSKHDPFTCW